MSNQDSSNIPVIIAVIVGIFLLGFAAIGAMLVGAGFMFYRNASSAVPTAVPVPVQSGDPAWQTPLDGDDPVISPQVAPTPWRQIGSPQRRTGLGPSSPVIPPKYDTLPELPTNDPVIAPVPTPIPVPVPLPTNPDDLVTPAQIPTSGT